MLSHFYTGIAIDKKSYFNLILFLMPRIIKKKLSNRIIDGVPANKITNIIFPELISIILIAIKRNSEEVLFKRNLRFQKSIPNKAIIDADVVIGFDTSSWILIDRCKQLGKKFILDVSIAHPNSKQKIFQEIAIKYPSWKFALNTKSKYLLDFEQYELLEANAIVVASSFSKKTLIENCVEQNKIFLNPYGVDIIKISPILKKQSEKIKYLFIGLVDARKGIPFLLEVWKKINSSNSTLTLIGPISEQARGLILRASPDIIILGKLPFDELNKVLPQYDVLIFPSYFEGFGLVILEAMAAGLPIITTYSTCGSDIITSQEGFLINAGNIEQLQSALEYFNSNVSQIETMGRKARIKAEMYTWNSYGERWKIIINKFEE